MSYRKTPERCLGYRPLYKGRGIWIFENDPVRPFSITHYYQGLKQRFKETWTEQIIAYARDDDAVIALGRFGADGEIHASIAFGNGETFTAKTPRDMASFIKVFDKDFFKP